jgi:hypothetical protein
MPQCSSRAALLNHQFPSEFNLENPTEPAGVNGRPVAQGVLGKEKRRVSTRQGPEGMIELEAVSITDREVVLRVAYFDGNRCVWKTAIGHRFLECV